MFGGVHGPSSHGFAALGDGVRIGERVLIVGAGAIEIGAGTRLADDVFLQGGTGLRIGDRVEIGPFVSVAGGGRSEIGDEAVLCAGCRVLTGTEVVDGSGLTNPTAPKELRAVMRAGVRIGAHARIGANAVVLPGRSLGEGAVVGGAALVAHDLEPWTVYAGRPCRPVGRRAAER
jgi:acetyltransferase-like isoleucine patch superfamily enzyme